MAAPSCEPPTEREHPEEMRDDEIRDLALAIREGLLFICRWIERRYGVTKRT
jgi:hypothetical protein